MKNFLRSIALLAILLFLGIGTSRAQPSTMRVWIDTIVAQPGDDAILSVHYSFTSNKPHDIHGYVARLKFDPLLIRVVDILTEGTATAGMDTVQKIRSGQAGFVAFAQQEIDLSNPILFQLHVQLSPRLGDTAFVRWDSSYVMFEPTYGVDSTVQIPGWVIPPARHGHVVLSSQAQSVRSDSVVLLPIAVSDLTPASIKSGVLVLTYDSLRFDLRGAIAGSLLNTQNDIQITSVVRTHDSIWILFNAANGVVHGKDTLVTLQLYTYEWYDTVCTGLHTARLIPLNTDAPIGNTSFDFQPICVYGSHYRIAKVEPSAQSADWSFLLSPNPATDRVTIRSDSPWLRIEILDINGRKIFQTADSADWRIPAWVPNGDYLVIADNGKVQRSRKLVISR